MPGLEDDAHAAASHFFEQIIVGKSARGPLRGRGKRLFDKLVCLAEPFQQGGVLGALPESAAANQATCPAPAAKRTHGRSARQHTPARPPTRDAAAHLVRGDALAGDPVAALLGQDGVEETFGQAIGLGR